MPWRSIQEENFWTASLVAKFLRDERYIGKTVFGKRSRDIRLNLADEIEALLETLRRESCTA